MDLGDCFTYTGEGGRALKGTKANPKNLRTAPQSKDQTLTKGNLALSLNIETRKPVRVIRGYKANTEFTPEYGYRYDGKKQNNFFNTKTMNLLLLNTNSQDCIRWKSIGCVLASLASKSSSSPLGDAPIKRLHRGSPINGKRRKRKKNQTKVKMVKRSRKVSRPTKKIVIKASTPLHQLLLRNE
jgi:hypothetical protein